MTFGEWADSLEANAYDSLTCGSVREIARRAWNKATEVERERCAKLVEESPRRGYAIGDMRNLVQLIRQGESQ